MDSLKEYAEEKSSVDMASVEDGRSVDLSGIWLHNRSRKMTQKKSKKENR